MFLYVSSNSPTGDERIWAIVIQSTCSILTFFFHSECSFATLTSVVMTIYLLPPLCPKHSQLIRDRTPSNWFVGHWTIKHTTGKMLFWQRPADRKQNVGRLISRAIRHTNGWGLEWCIIMGKPRLIAHEYWRAAPYEDAGIINRSEDCLLFINDMMMIS